MKKYTDKQNKMQLIVMQMAKLFHILQLIFKFHAARSIHG